MTDHAPEDNQLTVFEIKTSPKRSDVDFFSLKVKLVAAQNPGKQVRGVCISLVAPAEIHQLCAAYGLELVD